MFHLVSEDMLIDFFLHYNIDILLFDSFQYSIILLLSNVLFVLMWFFILYWSYKLFHKIYSFIF